MFAVQQVDLFTFCELQHPQQGNLKKIHWHILIKVLPFNETIKLTFDAMT